MSGRRAIFGLCALCALLVSAFAAQSASAAGTTAFTCVKGAGAKNLWGEHCLASDPGGTAQEYGHVEIGHQPTDETSITATNGTTGGATVPTALKATIGGVSVTLTATAVTGEEGKLLNKETGTGEMYTHLTGRLHYTNVTATKGCSVYADNSPTEMGAKETVVTEPLTATTEGLTNKAKIQPASGTVFARFYLTECEAAFSSLNGTYTVSGSIKTTTIEGATAKFTHADTTAQETLSVNNVANPAGITGSLTIKGANGNAITVT
jgi:hypothetical protein